MDTSVASNLFTAYNYLSSAIAQAFAALIALTAMFYIYRRQMLKNQIKELCDRGRSLSALLKTMLNSQDIEKREKMANTFIAAENLEPEANVIDYMRQIVNLPKEPVEGRDCREQMRLLLDDINKFKEIDKHFQKIIKSAIIVPAITMLVGIVALLAGPKIGSGLWLYAIMVAESALAAFALGWTVAVVIRMLAEPKEPK